MLIPPSSTQNPSFILESIPTNKDHYLIFMASPSEERPGRPWCRDCEHAEAPISANIKDNESTLIYVGSREEWNKPDNPYRQSPFNVDRVPTVIKVSAKTSSQAITSTSGEVQTKSEDRVLNAPRLVEGEILENSKLKAFLKA